MKFLKFADKAAFEQAFAPYMYTDENNVQHPPAYIDNVAVDVIGIIPVHNGEYTTVDAGDGETVEVPVMVDSEGYHVNLSGPLPQFAEFEVEQPATPYRVFAGWDAEPEPERVPPQVPRWAAVLALKSNPCPAMEDRTLWEAVTAIRNQIIAKPDDENVEVAGITLVASVDLKNRIVAALDDANYWERDSELVNLMATAIGLTQPDVDALFIWAGKQHM